MKKLGIVILNYINFQDTIDCVDSILNQDYINYNIIIVDNKSSNESIEEIRNRFEGNTKITLIVAEKNEGFAKGNNLGIRYAIEELNCTDIFLLNSDTVLLTKDVLSSMMNCCGKGIGLVNPTCIGCNNKIQTPYGRFTQHLFLETLRALFNIFSGTIQNIFKINYGLSKRINGYNLEQLESQGYIVQGAAYILTAEFFKYYKQLFPKTFLYGEELNLAWYLDKVGLRTMVDQNAKILHKEGGSTGNIGTRKIMNKFCRQLASFFHSLPVFTLNYQRIVKRYN